MMENSDVIKAPSDDCEPENLVNCIPSLTDVTLFPVHSEREEMAEDLPTSSTLNLSSGLTHSEHDKLMHQYALPTFPSGQ